jgi:hypothetical protein
MIRVAMTYRLCSPPRFETVSRAFEAWQAVVRRKAAPLFRRISSGDGIGEAALHPQGFYPTLPIFSQSFTYRFAETARCSLEIAPGKPRTLRIRPVAS